MRVLKLAALAACLFAVTSSVAAPFPSSTRMMTGTPVAAGSGIVPYQEYSDKSKCPVAASCVIVFPAITSSGVFIQKVACILGVKTGGTIAYAALGINGQQPFNILSPTKLSAMSDGELYGDNAQTDLFVDVGQKPQVLIALTGKKITGMDCTITGFHV